MSTTPTPQPSPVLVKISNYFNEYAVFVAGLVQKEQADIAAHDHIAAINDAVVGAASALTAQVPALAPNIGSALNLFVGAESIIVSLVSLFHHPTVAAAVATTPATPLQSGS